MCAPPNSGCVVLVNRPQKFVYKFDLVQGDQYIDSDATGNVFIGS